MDEETEGHLGWFYILVFINNAMMNKRVHICFQTSVLCSFEKETGDCLYMYVGDGVGTHTNRHVFLLASKFRAEYITLKC